MQRSVLILAALALVPGCLGPVAPFEPPPLPLSAGYVDPPEGAPEGSCWGRALVPAIVETVTEQVVVAPASYNTDGTLATPTTFETVQRQQIVRERGEHAFEAVCEEDLTAEVVGTLQRALAVREQYNGPITEEMDWPTRQALKARQKLDGPDSDILSIDLARRLGVVAVDRATLE
ncbi:peptidoglycan-binding domain-containing protein [Pseudaestuariivita sp.]|uniref:peptidoglycan-binding domain-containing protein n=1 Tax=Pseudaestuariivita sp. TaxID=2211669 RepID=UPI004059933F